jgi:hypothetical protein
MAGYSAYDTKIRRRTPARWPWFVAGLLIGAGLGWGASKVFEKSAPTETAEHAVAARPTAVPLQPLRFVARLGRGMSLVAGTPLTLTDAGTGKLAEQKGNDVFVGLRNWDGTINYLMGGDAALFLRDKQNAKVSGGWKGSDYRRFARGTPLQLKIKPDTTYTIFFQRNGSNPINLGAFTVGPAPQSPVATATPTAAPG